ncbi:TM2 domain-containing protein [Trichoplax sp. H2]|nr:TM2 domain-containing protein [Trichoplax sp. H2]|eukprot:RDD45936.1 TM2 domain-containing protein [Trichoplax sp. H2]
MSKGMECNSPNNYNPMGDRLQVVRPSLPKKSIADAYLLAFPLGILGLHRFYLGQKYLGLAYFFSFGLFGLGWLHDLVFMPSVVNHANRCRALPQEKKPYSLLEAYILCLNPAGIFFGLHQFYLGRKGFGTAYCFTIGLFGVGWLSDILRMPKLVADANKRAMEIQANPEVAKQKKAKKIDDAYILCVFGFLGLHHFYLGNIGFGFAYLFTMGMGGIGWLVDFLRMPILVARANDPNPSPKKHLDDAYILTFPLGMLGLQHFYLGRPGWGVTYMFTLGLAGFGFLVDLVRMPFLVRQVNDTIIEGQNLLGVAIDSNYNGNQPQFGNNPSVNASNMPYQAPNNVMETRKVPIDNGNTVLNYPHKDVYPPPPSISTEPPPAYESKVNLR